ncbi:hypothetical protein HFP43_34970 [Streptomyces sp. SJ1-7]|nr:hypothetical protein [Streptomyces sp. SJ1-7]
MTLHQKQITTKVNDTVGPGAVRRLEILGPAVLASPSPPDIRARCRTAPRHRAQAGSAARSPGGLPRSHRRPPCHLDQTAAHPPKIQATPYGTRPRYPPDPEDEHRHGWWEELRTALRPW